MYLSFCAAIQFSRFFSFPGSTTVAALWNILNAVVAAIQAKVKPLDGCYIQRLEVIQTPWYNWRIEPLVSPWDASGILGAHVGLSASTLEPTTSGLYFLVRFSWTSPIGSIIAWYKRFVKGKLTAVCYYLFVTSHMPNDTPCRLFQYTSVGCNHLHLMHHWFLRIGIMIFMVTGTNFIR